MGQVPTFLTIFLHFCNVRITHAPFLGVYQKEEAHLLLKTFQIKGPVDIVSNFEDNSWGLDGNVSTSWRVI